MSALNKPASNMSGQTAFTEFFILTAENVSELVNYLQTSNFLDDIALLFTNPADNIISLRLYPFDIKNLTGNISPEVDIHISTANTGVKGIRYGGFSIEPINLGEIDILPYFNSFLDFSPYTKIEIYLPYIGFVELDTNIVMGKKIKIEYVIDVFTGKCGAFITVDGNIILTREGVIGCDIQIGGGQGAEIAKNMLKLGLQTVGGSAASFATGAAISGGNVAAGRTAAVSYLASTSVNAIQAMQVHISKGNTSHGSAINLFTPQHCYLIITRPSVVYPSNYNHSFGKPSGIASKLKDLNGYTVVEAVHVEGISTATSEEIAEVERLLKQGVIL